VRFDKFLIFVAKLAEHLIVIIPRVMNFRAR
jgi:hypothetical protein